MKVFNRFAAVAVALMVATPAVSFAQALPKPEELFAKHVAAVGGKDALSQIKSMKQVGKLEVAGMSADVEMSIAAPNRTLMKTTIAGMGEMLQGFDGTVAWENTPMSGPRVLADKELANRKEDADFLGVALFSPERFTKTETVEQTDYAGEKAYKVKATLKSGREVTYYFSVASGLQIGSSRLVESQMGSMQVSEVTSDYKQFGPLKFATKMETQMGPQKIVMTFTNFTFGDVPPTTFALPDAIKALVKP